MNIWFQILWILLYNAGAIPLLFIMWKEAVEMWRENGLGFAGNIFCTGLLVVWTYITALGEYFVVFALA